MATSLKYISIMAHKIVLFIRYLYTFLLRNLMQTGTKWKLDENSLNKVLENHLYQHIILNICIKLLYEEKKKSTLMKTLIN